MLSDKRKERISAFLDNDLHRDELMSFSLSGESEDAKVAQRYHMVGDALRDGLSESSFVDVSSAVRDAIENEETYSNAPVDVSQASTSVSTATNDAVENNIKKGFFSLTSWLKPAAGFAVAASVAVVMVVTVSDPETGIVAPVANNALTKPAAQVATQIDKLPTNQALSRQVAAQNQANQTPASQTQAVNVQLSQIGRSPAAGSIGPGSINQDSKNQRLINQRLVNQHLNYATQDTLQGRMPIVRAVSYEADK